MQKKITIIGIVVFIAIIVLVFWELPVEVKTVPIATIRFPKISWIQENDEKEEKESFSVRRQIYNDSGLTYMCSKKKTKTRTEDILCMKPPRYLPHYKNPCWYQDNSNKLSCLPYFLQIGVSKCGTTDLFTRLVLHPDLIQINGDEGSTKSLSWWNLRLTGSSWVSPYVDLRWESFNQYVQHFSHPAKVIEESTDQEGIHKKITGEGSPTYIWMLYLWKRIPQNAHLTEPRVLMPHLIRHLLPNMKFIVILRDPIERMYSSYHFFNVQSTFDEHTFHSTMLNGIKEFNECKSKKGDRLCALDPDFVHKLSLANARFMNSMYYLFIKEWLDVFPREQFHFIKMEDYVTRKEDVLNRVFKFLGVKMLTQQEMKEYGLLSKIVKNKTQGKKQYDPMLNETRELLYKFYDPYTKQLPQLLNDSTFVWPKVPYEEYVRKMEKKRLLAKS